ncbi:cupin domain-containing protein [Natronorarus salvus]|uniref:cupin domain-containing protein n=1 Tax=Natronorarus salvus TaxID=3117733 RepID=UPI002F26B525
MTNGFSIVDEADVPRERFPESGITHRKLTEALGCTELRVNTVTLAPGEATAPHSHARQEEVYVALDGGQVRIEGEVYELSSGDLVRIGPGTVRSVHNEGEESQTWLMFGAPPLGTVDDFGEYRMPDRDG